MKYEIKVVDKNFGWDIKNEKNTELEKDINDFINNVSDDSYFDIDDDLTLHSIIPVYNSENEIDKYIVLVKDDKKKICVNFISENNDIIKSYEFRNDKVNLLTKIKKVTIDEMDYSIEDVIYNLNENEINFKCNKSEVLK